MLKQKHWVGRPHDTKDLCEAWALHNFGRLCLMRIRRQIRTSEKLRNRRQIETELDKKKTKTAKARDSCFFLMTS